MIKSLICAALKHLRTSSDSSVILFLPCEIKVKTLVVTWAREVFGPVVTEKEDAYWLVLQVKNTPSCLHRNVSSGEPRLELCATSPAALCSWNVPCVFSSPAVPAPDLWHRLQHFVGQQRQVLWTSWSGEVKVHFLWSSAPLCVHRIEQQWNDGLKTCTVSRTCIKMHC